MVLVAKFVFMFISFHTLFLNSYLFLVDWWLLYNIGLICHTSTWINQTCTYVPSLLNLPPPTPIPTSLGYYRVPVWVPWAIQQIPIGCLFTNVGAYASMLLFPFISLSPFCPQPLSVSLFSMSASPLLVCEQICQYHPSRFHIYALIYNIWFSLSDLLHCLIGSRFIHFIRTDSNGFYGCIPYSL